MFIYKKSLQYPVKIDKPNPRLASIIISQYGGPYRKKIYTYAFLVTIYILLPIMTDQIHKVKNPSQLMTGRGSFTV